MFQLHTPLETRQSPLAAFFEQSIARGQHQLADAMRRRLYLAAPALAELLDFDDDGIYLEPLLFAAFRGAREPSGRELWQVLSGRITPADRRPEIEVVADQFGVVHLPAIGYFRTGCRNTALQLKWTNDARIAQLRAGGVLIESDFEAPLVIPGTRIEIAGACHPLLEPLFVPPDSSAAVPRIVAPRIHAQQLADALACIGQYMPHYLAYMQTVTRRVLLFKGSSYSFAAIGAHGMAFLSLQDDPSAAFFVEDMVHQCGHIIFNAITLERDAFFAVDSRRSLRDVLGVDDDGSLYGAYHGLFTQAHINQCLVAMHRAGTLRGSLQHEVAGRIADDMKRFASALELLGKRPLYTELGWSLLLAFRATFDRLFAQQRDMILGLDTSNQPYIFDFKMFVERNPLLQATAMEGAAP